MPESSNCDNDTTSTGLRDSTKSVSSTSNEDIGVGVIPKNNSRHHNSDSIIDSIIVGSVSPQPVDVEVTSGDRLILLKTANNDHFRLNAYEHMIKINCTLPEILHKVQEGHRVFIDDGKIEVVVLESTNEYLVLEIVSPSDTTANKNRKRPKLSRF
jgi:Pyruvate kinase, barrel domain